MLNKRIGNMYKFIDYTWNPIRGGCLHDCSYCYMKRYNEEVGKILLASWEFRTGLGTGNSIFIGSSTDMFADNIPSGWIKKVLDYCYQTNDPVKPNTFLLQSKNPKRFLEFLNHPFMERAVLCTTIESNRFYPDIMNNAPQIEERVKAMEEIAGKGFKTMVTAEPLMEFDLDEMLSIIKRCKPRLVNIGRNTHRDILLPEPPSEKVQKMIDELKQFTKVNVKENAKVWSV